jgi:hypothetical protein
MTVILPAGWSDFNTGCCTDATERGQQFLVPSTAFVNNSTKGGNTLTTWSYISPTGELYTVIGEATCAGGNMAYNDTCMEINHFAAEGAVTDRPLVISPDGSPMNPPPIGSADEPFYFSKHGQFGYYPVPRTRVFMDAGGGSNGWSLTTYAKRDTHFFAMGIDFGAGDPDFRIADFDATTGAINGIFSLDLTLFNMTNGCATDDFLYCLTSLISDSTIRAIKKVNRSDLTLADSFDLTGIGPKYMYAVNDSTIYILTGGNPMALYYIKDFTTLVYVGSLAIFNSTNFGGNQGFFTNGAFYWGSIGVSNFSTDIAKVPLECPDNLLIASVTTAPTVVAGSDIVVDWSGVLEPNTNDRLYLKADDSVRFDTSPLSNQTPGLGTASGTFAFPISGGTTPGQYVIQYVYQDVNLVATSAPFTVT